MTPSRPASLLVGTHINIICLTIFEIYCYSGVVKYRPHEALAALVEKPLHRSPRNAQCLTGFSLVQAIDITQPHGLELVEFDLHRGNLFHGDPLGLVDPVGGVSSAKASFPGSGQVISFHYVHMHINNIGPAG
jgi:hypothetical protein